MAERRSWRPGRARRAREDALLKAAVEWRETFDAIESAILVVDLDGRIARLNGAAQRLFGLDFKDLLGRPIGSSATREPVQTIADAARVASEARASVSRRARGPCGKEWLVSASFVAAETRDARRVIAIARDVSEVVRLETSLRRFETMAALGTLVSGVAHEVRNPLFAISATVDALEVRVSGREEIAPFLGALRGEIDRLGKVMRDLLEYGKPPALELVEADIGEVVAAAARAIEARAAEHAVTVRNLVPPDLARLRLDPVRVAQVVQNLIENARQHSPRGADVELRGAVSGESGSRQVEISVADRGPGLPRGEQARIFEPFFSRRAGGTGLGLAIVKRLVEAHGGAVEARDRPGGGALVSFCIPMAAAAPASGCPVPGNGTGPGGDGGT